MKKIILLFCLLSLIIVSKGFAYDEDWDFDTPLGTTDAGTLDTEIQDFKKGIAERLNNDHWFPEDDDLMDELTVGDHRQVTMLEKAAAPAEETSTGILYVIADGTDSELGYTDAGGNDIQITKDGALNLTGGYSISDLTVSNDVSIGDDIVVNDDATIQGDFYYGDSLIDNPVVQIELTQSGAVQTGTTVVPDDDTIPQKTDGDEYMTLTITPESDVNILKIDVVINVSGSVAGPIIAALFQDATGNALTSAMTQDANGETHVNTLAFTYRMVSGTTDATTFRVRAGLDRVGTTTINGRSGARLHGGVLTSSITITEYKG